MSLSGSKLWPTGFAGMRLGAVAYIVPFMFVFYPELILRGWWLDVVVAAVTAVVGVAVLSAGLVGYLFRSISWPVRIAFVVAGLALMTAPTAWPQILANLIGAGTAGVLILGLLMRHRQLAAAETAGGG